VKSTIRRPAVAGSWYPGSATAIVAEIEGYLGQVPALQQPQRLIALISPHAGLRYSGPVAAHGYALLRGSSELTVVLVGPSHRFEYKGVAVWSRGAFETPLGSTPIDEALADALMAADSEWIVDGPRPHQEEHSLEMQLPFLQHLVAGLRLVPCLMGSQSRPEVDALAAALATAVGSAERPVLLIASSDLSHYHPAPVANRMDALVVDHVARLDHEGLMARLEERREHACGGGPMVAVMKAARELGARRSTVLRYADSGEAGERDKSRVVGYVSAALSLA
jgi:AmmeMemoRadiSam system protein B